jgi:tetratricopeptide (TPR) repeat protein
MYARITLFAQRLCAILIIQLTCISYANTSTQLEKAETLFKNGQYEQAETIYKKIVADQSGTDYAFQAQEKLTCLYVSWGKDELVKSSQQRLVTDFRDHPNISEAVIHIGDTYRNKNRHNNAVSSYQYVLDNWPKSKYNIWALAGLVICNTCLKNSDAADAAFEKLSANYSNHPQFYQALNVIGDNLRWRNINSEKARQMYTLAAKGISANESIWTKTGLAVTSIRLSDFQTGDSLKEQILTDYADDNRLPEVANLIADAYRDTGKYEVAAAFYNDIMNKWPSNKILLWAKVGLARIDIARGNDAATQKVIDNIISEFRDHPEMPNGVFSIGEQYWAQAFSEHRQDDRKKEPNDKSIEYFTKALAVWERIIKELPPSITTAQAYQFSAECYRQLGQYEKAIEYYQKVVDNWPYYEYAWHAQFLIARCLEELENSGRISKEEAAIQIIHACERLFSDYPDCRAVEAARDLLVRWSSTEIEELIDEEHKHE